MPAKALTVMLRNLAMALGTTSLAFVDVNGAVAIHHEGQQCAIDVDGTPMFGEPSEHVMHIYRLAAGSGANVLCQNGWGLTTKWSLEMH